jgi:hypothetical protein
MPRLPYITNDDPRANTPTAVAVRERRGGGLLNLDRALLYSGTTRRRLERVSRRPENTMLARRTLALTGHPAHCVVEPRTVRV